MRRCGECTVCCTVMHIPDTDSPNHEPCKHLCATGCSIYSTRPNVCRTWSCQWIQDNMYKKDMRLLRDVRDRPDRCGIMVDITPQATMVAYEVWPGAVDAAAGEEVLERLRKRGKVTVVRA